MAPGRLWTWGEGKVRRGPTVHQALCLGCATERKAPARLPSRPGPLPQALRGITPLFLQPLSFLPSVISKIRHKNCRGWRAACSPSNVTYASPLLGMMKVRGLIVLWGWGHPAGCRVLTASEASTHQTPGASPTPAATTTNVPRHRQVPPGGQTTSSREPLS